MSIENNNMVRFGKFLLSHLDSPIQQDEIDWGYIIRQFVYNACDRKPGLMYINWVVAHYFNKDPVLIRESGKKKGKREDTEVKHIVFYIAMINYKYASTSLAEFYGMNHTSILYGKKTVANLMDTDEHVRKNVENITNKLIKYDYSYENTWTNTGRSTNNVQEPIDEKRNDMSIHRDRKI